MNENGYEVTTYSRIKMTLMIATSSIWLADRSKSAGQYSYIYSDWILPALSSKKSQNCPWTQKYWQLIQSRACRSRSFRFIRNSFGMYDGCMGKICQCAANGLKYITVNCCIMCYESSLSRELSLLVSWHDKYGPSLEGLVWNSYIK